MIPLNSGSDKSSYEREYGRKPYSHYAKEPHRFVPMSLPARFEDCYWCALRRDHWVHRPMETQDDPCGKFLSGDPDHPQMCVRCGFEEQGH